MRKPVAQSTARFAVFVLVVALAVLLQACGGTEATPTLVPSSTATAPPATATVPASIEHAVQTIQAGPPTPTPAIIDLKSLDVCTLIPADQVAHTIGTLSGQGKPTISVAEEKGCEWTNDKGNFADLIVNSPFDWDLQKALNPDYTALGGIGDDAFTIKHTDALELWVLLTNRAILEVRVSSQNQNQAGQLALLLMHKLP
jgi:hypothetical protein